MPCRFCEAAASKRKKQCVKRREGERERGREGEDNERARARLLECVGRLEGIASERVTVTLKRNAKLGGE